jgi:hypothetical protein
MESSTTRVSSETVNSVESQTNSEENSNECQQITTQIQSLNLLINGIEVAQKRGAFSLDEAEMLNKARKMFIKPESSNESDNTSNESSSNESTSTQSSST